MTGIQGDSIVARALVVLIAAWGVAGGVRAEDLQEGLIQTRFVSSEQITAPTGISVSPEGVAFVSCDPNGISGQKSGLGRVVRCEDTDDDGAADKFSLFVEGIDSPRGSCYVDDTLYLVQPPFLVSYEDPDEDGVAEKKTVLVTNLGQPLDVLPANHGPNGVRMGIDGWLYLAVGDQGCHEATGTDGSSATLRGGGVLRVRPDGSQLSVLLSGTRNIYDIAVDPFLDLFARDNTNDGGGWNTRLHHLCELADFGYPHLYRTFSHEHLGSLADYGPGAGSGMYYLHEPGFPEGVGDTLFSGDFNTGVAIHARKRYEESYQIQQERFLDLPQNTGVDVDGCSRLYFASWGGGGFGFAAESFGHIDLVQPGDRASAADYRAISKASPAELIGHLANPSQVARINAMREILSRGRKPAFTDGLLALAQQSETPLYARAAAVMTLKQLNGAQSHQVLQGLYGDRDLREFVVRALGDVVGEIDGISKEVALRALKDGNPRVRLRAVVALARAGDVGAAAAILPLAKDERMVGGGSTTGVGEPDADGWSAPRRALSHVALKAVVRLKAVDLLLGRLDDAELRETALRGLQEIHTEKVVAGLAAKVGATTDKQLVRLITLALFRLYHREERWDGAAWWGSRPNFRGPYFNGVTWEQTPAVRSAIVSAFNKADPADYADLFTHMRRNQVPEGELGLEIAFDEVLSFLEKKELTDAEFTRVMNAVADKQRPEKELLEIYRYFERGPLPESYFNRAHILRVWGEGKATGKLQRQAYNDFVSGKEFIGKVGDLEPFFKSGEKGANKYAHLQLLSLINSKSTPGETRKAAAAELEKTWADKKNIYPHRLRGLMLAFEEVDPTPYAEQLKPLVEHRDERTKQPAARFLEAIKNGTAAPSGQ